MKYKRSQKRIRVGAGLVRRLIWVEDQLCSNHSNPTLYADILITVCYVYTIYMKCIFLSLNNDIKFKKGLFWILSMYQRTIIAFTFY